MSHAKKLAVLGVAAGCAGFLGLAQPALADWDDYWGYNTYSPPIVQTNVTPFNPYISYPYTNAVSPYGYTYSTVHPLDHPIIRSVGNALLNGWY